ncbi:MAG TPA: RagB/SusD family nutrient uptake outer membrane protein [Flavisolibacter sp.]|nr:RagB/SusD family nutrient uptake outer membrane protein [Flavisolibacter sp.]
MKYVLLATVLLTTMSCKKFLEQKPDTKLAIPNTVKDLQLLLDNYSTFNNRTGFLGEIMSDDYYLSVADWAAIGDPAQRNLYNWQADDNTNFNWSGFYGSVYLANVVLDNLQRIQHNAEQNDERDHIRGAALFFRSMYLYEAVSLFAKPFNASSAATDLGVPLRLTADYAVPSERGNVVATYQQILSDYKEAASLLPVQTLMKTRPSKAAAYGALARTYLSMRIYDSAGYYADKCLGLYDSLLDYNSLNAAASFPINRFNREVIFHSKSVGASPLVQSRFKVDSTLYQSYRQDDLRKTVFFKNVGTGVYTFKGDYDGADGAVFSGITTGEMYLVRAECFARSGNTMLAMNDLNHLLKARFKSTGFTPLTASTPDEALGKVLAERRKELIMRGLRWTDLRRFTFEPEWTIVPKRVLNAQVFELHPQSSRYVVKLPKQVVERSTLQQNP